MYKLGLTTISGKRGTTSRLREQLHRLLSTTLRCSRESAACRVFQNEIERLRNIRRQKSPADKFHFLPRDQLKIQFPHLEHSLEE